MHVFIIACTLDPNAAEPPLGDIHKGISDIGGQRISESCFIVQNSDPSAEVIHKFLSQFKSKNDTLAVFALGQDWFDGDPAADRSPAGCASKYLRPRPT
jgi:hypothetical protein